MKKSRLNKCNFILNNTKIINFDDVPEETMKEINQIWPDISDHPYRILIIGGS